MKNILNEIVNYYNIGIFPNICGTIAACDLVKDVSDRNWGGVASNAWITGLSLGVGFIKYLEYKKVKKSLSENGWDERIVKPKSYTWCQRHAARQAAKETGNLEKFDNFIKREGHEWYHFLPKMHKINEMIESIKSENNIK